MGLLDHINANTLLSGSYYFNVLARCSVSCEFVISVEFRQTYIFISYYIDKKIFLYHIISLDL